MLKKLTILAVIFSLALRLSADIYQLPVAEIDGEDYYIYTVEPGEGLYSISQKLEIPISDIERHNPQVKDGVKLGQKLSFLKSEYDSILLNKRTPSKHTARKGETVYGISRQYGMTTADFIELNPASINGVKEGETYDVYIRGEVEAKTVAQAPVKTEPAKVVTEEHIIQPGETLYSIATKAGCTVGQLLDANPGLSFSHYEIGQKINIPKGSAEVKSKVASAFAGKHHVVKKGDTFYGISRQYGVTIEQLQKANPGINILSEGMALVIPGAEPEPAATATSTDVTPVTLTVVENKEEEQPAVTTPMTNSQRITMALILPFMTSGEGKEKNSKEAVTVADFYRGFMLAVDSMKSDLQPMTIMAFDSERSPEKVEQILADPALLKADMIIAPNDSTFDAVAEFGRKHKINVLNIFDTQDDSYLTNPYMFQSNIPYDKMVDKMTDYFADYVGSSTVVILRSALVDKNEVVNAVKAKMQKNGVPMLEVSYKGNLSLADLNLLSKNGDYVFLPTTANLKHITEMLSVLAEYESKRTGSGQMRLFGYPEWTLFKGTQLENMKKVNTTIYSRFFLDNSEDGMRGEVYDFYKHWYGHDVPAGVPRVTITGFDTAMYLIKALSYNHGNFSLYSPSHFGEQKPYNFVQSGSEGWYNNGVYIINYHPSGVIDKTPL